MYQRFIAVGRLGRDPETTTTSSGMRVATLSLATSEYVKGEERTEWHRVVVWDERLIEVLQRRAKRGSLVAVEGQVRTRRWLRDGRDVATTEIVLDRFNSRLQILANGRVPGESTDLFAHAESRSGAEHQPELHEDEIPF
jgi:single-strand DNA-binding protein